ncbi:MAG TPA: TIGR01777 family oxidoreductase [Pseudogracilibacillus sp.]|nr:TIGR01777 family oxidoreductase [Pseudogracilibacillus sp.]
MNILITGGTGFVGTALKNKLIEQGNHVFIMTRSPDKYRDEDKIKYISYDEVKEDLPKIHAVYNLAGESLFGRWTESKRRSILNSRIDSTNKILDFIAQLDERPDVFINASAVGFYGMDNERIFTEETREPGSDFLAHVTTEWEKNAQRSETLGIRTVYARFGIILAKDAGALSLMKLPFQSFVGGKVGRGKQWMSWVHLEDCVNILIFAKDNKKISGPLNVTSPFPKRNEQFSKLLGTALKRPAFFTLPKGIISSVLGDMSSLITEGQYVYPDKALEHDFIFTFPQLTDALHDIFQK